MLFSARKHRSGRPLAGFAGFGAALSVLAIAPALAGAATCPQIKNKPGAVAHAAYQGVQHLTYCVPVTISPGQNVIRYNGTSLKPNVPGFITRFDPELVYDDGKVPRVDVIHLHHAVWLVKGSPQFAAGEEKTITQLPQGFGWRSEPGDSWVLNDMLHNLVSVPTHVYIVWRMDFVPDTSPDAAGIKTVYTRWMDASGPASAVGISSPIYPVFNALRGMGAGNQYTFPDEASAAQQAFIGPNQSWTPNHPVTLIGTAGHLHPGGLSTSLHVTRGATDRKVFQSDAHYYEPAGAVSWDVSMGATPASWRAKLQAGDTLSVNATYDVKRADWYEVMGIMPVAVYDDDDAGGKDALDLSIPKNEVLTHTHLRENRHHGGDPTGLPNPLQLGGAPTPADPIGIFHYAYEQGGLLNAGAAVKPPKVKRGHSLTYLNEDAGDDTYHSVTACKAPCNRDTGIAYPISNGPATFDSGQLGFNSTPFGAPATETDTWKTPKNLKTGTYSFFCRVHPFMRGSFRVVK